jgi:mannan endo-1,4-beta-mannosidase
MKLSAAFALAFASIACSSPISETSDALSKRASNAFAVGTKINIEGSTKYFVGANSNWTSYLLNDGDVDVTFAHLKASGVKVFRVWGTCRRLELRLDCLLITSLGFKDIGYITIDPQSVWFQSLPKWNPVSINTGANGLQRLDAVVKAAEKYGIKLIIPFVNWNNEVWSALCLRNLWLSQQKSIPLLRITIFFSNITCTARQPFTSRSRRIRQLLYHIEECLVH